MKIFDLYQYDVTEIGTHSTSFLTLLNRANAIIPDERIRNVPSNASRKLIAAHVTLSEAQSILRGRKLCSVEPITFPAGGSGLAVHYTCYTLESGYGIEYTNPGIKDEIEYDGKLYHPMDAGSMWGDDRD